MYLFFPEITHLLMKKANPNALSKRNTFGFAWYGAPSGTRTQDPLIKSQLLSLVARTHGALSSIHNCSSIGFLNSTIHPIT